MKDNKEKEKLKVNEKITKMEDEYKEEETEEKEVDLKRNENY